MIPRRLVLVTMVVLVSLRAAAQDVPADVSLADMVRSSAIESAAQVTSPSVTLLVAPEQAPVLVTQVFAEELRNRGLTVLTAPAAGADLLQVDVREMRFSTASGPNSSYLRNLSTVLAVLISSTNEQTHRWSKEYTLTRQDTLTRHPSDTERDLLQSGSGFWSSVLEPTMVIVAGVVILVLLFTVRGSS
ncbi:MAG: hypothetical protein M5R41_08095 [Bacteroidia bacterium]|nr:hypothetical protein [Bacteroidia bacterium]